MSERTDTPDASRGQVSTAAAEIYESFFVPALFAQFAEPVLDRAGVRSGSRVLDVGCGTGALTRVATTRVGPDGVAIGIDPNEGMVAVARRVGPTVAWRTGTAEQLPFPDRSFDHVIAHFAAMFFDDRATALTQMARVCTDGGTVTIATWAGLDRTPGYAAMVALIADEIGRAAADALRAPFSLGRPSQVRDLLRPIGHDIEVDEIDGTARFASIESWVDTDVRGWTLTDLVDDAAEERLVERANRDLARFVADDGSVAFPAPAIVGTAVIR